MFKGNMSKLLKQAKDMQEQIEEAQNHLSEMIVDAESGGGMVSVQVNGKQEILDHWDVRHALDIWRIWCTPVLR